MNQNTKLLLGALVAAALAIAGYYGVISPQQATNYQNQANQVLGTGPQQAGQSAPNGLPQAIPQPQASAAPQRTTPLAPQSVQPQAH